MKIDIYNTDKKYNIIYADPPWSYRDKRKGYKMSGGATNHYKTMNIDEIKKIPIQNIADNNCMLFMWVTFPNLQEGLDTIEAWGFKYKTLRIQLDKNQQKKWKAVFWHRLLYKIKL